MAQPQVDDRSYFESSIRALEAEVANVGVHLAIYSSARQLYAKQIKAMSNALRIEVESGRLTWAQAAKQSQETRNVIMELMRGRSTPVGRAIAEDMKRNGRTLNERSRTRLSRCTVRMWCSTVFPRSSRTKFMRRLWNPPAAQSRA